MSGPSISNYLEVGIEAAEESVKSPYYLVMPVFNPSSGINTRQLSTGPAAGTEFTHIN